MCSACLCASVVHFTCSEIFLFWCDGCVFFFSFGQVAAFGRIALRSPDDGFSVNPKWHSFARRQWFFFYFGLRIRVRSLIASTSTDIVRFVLHKNAFTTWTWPRTAHEMRYPAPHSPLNAIHSSPVHTRSLATHDCNSAAKFTYFPNKI